MLIEYKQAGRYAIANRPLKYCYTVQKVADIHKAIEDILKKKEPDVQGSKYYRKLYNPTIVRKHFMRVLELLE